LGREPFLRSTLAGQRRQDAGAQTASSERRPGWPQRASGRGGTGSPVRHRSL